jgi:hypothetical protein
VFVWQLLVALLSLGFAKPQIRGLLRYAKEIDFARATHVGRELNVVCL